MHLWQNLPSFAAFTNERYYFFCRYVQPYARHIKSGTPGLFRPENENLSVRSFNPYFTLSLRLFQQERKTLLLIFMICLH